jgi:hypothetical protein
MLEYQKVLQLACADSTSLDWRSKLPLNYFVKFSVWARTSRGNRRRPMRTERGLSRKKFCVSQRLVCVSPR